MKKGRSPSYQDHLWVEKAVEFFGLTYKASESGYLLPDGRMLDFTGRSQVSHDYIRVGDIFLPKRGRDFMTDRVVDHREISSAFPEGELYDSDLSSMVQFMDKTGSIRMGMSPEVYYFTIIQTPTLEQKKSILLMVETGSYLGIDIWNNKGNRIKSFESDSITQKKLANILREI